MAQSNGFISATNGYEDDKPMLLMKKSMDSNQGNGGSGGGLTALINKQLQGKNKLTNINCNTLSQKLSLSLVYCGMA